MLLNIFLLITILSLRNSESFPSQFAGADEDDNSDRSSVMEGEINGRNGTECDECSPELCPKAVGCRAGLVLDRCGCCFECGNLEGQPCDLDSTNTFYGVCGSNLECKFDISDLKRGEFLEPQCVCTFEDPVCSSDGKTYLNMCQFKEAAYSTPRLRVESTGPCLTVPLIKVPPHNHVNVTGSIIMFLCEVFAYPMALIEWRKDGKDIVLPGDDPHVSVQSRGGPMKYELSSWLQIEGVSPEDAGTYRCVAYNTLGNISASAVLGVLGPDEMSAFSSEDMPGFFTYDHHREYDEDYY